MVNQHLQIKLLIQHQYLIKRLNQVGIVSYEYLLMSYVIVPPVGRRRRQRTIFLQDQVAILDQVFEKNRYPDIQLREQLSQRLDVPEARIQVCF